MYHFIRCQPCSKCPDLQGWYLILEPGDSDTLMKIHKGVTNFYYHKFGLDPHLTKSELASFYNPVYLASRWLRAVEECLLKGITLAINLSGGWVPLDNMSVLAEIESELLIWPNCDEDEKIVISRWPKGQHYYLSSNKNRIFIPSSYNTYEDAYQVAQKYTDNIQAKGC